ncbi:hypothetical protein GCM10012286_78980 [Streptomyces lasiicapitis]|uniref:Uncharacterized protein n=1 Tax=Streptomyces lasiicapitis TaxID=1923961 RepID=A0ABQ2MZD9_9ACTN|nr:hypothetical protein GCM10012286_78980 [Streptomyces lasiicapitis]
MVEVGDESAGAQSAEAGGKSAGLEDHYLKANLKDVDGVECSEAPRRTGPFLALILESPIVFFRRPGGRRPRIPCLAKESTHAARRGAPRPAQC